DPKNINGNALDEFIYTPGHVQQATINVSGELKKQVDLTPFDSDVDTSVTLRFSYPSYADDIMFGGLDSDFLHGGAGDDATSGALEHDMTIGLKWILDFNQAEGVPFDGGVTDKGLAYGPVHSDGNDVMFGDLGNDWIVGGTGRDDMYGGYGNDLLNSDDDTA